jgi:hypothetical protein
MGKYLQMLDELYGPDGKHLISPAIKVTKPTEALLPPFVSAETRGIQLFSNSGLQEPIKGIDDSQPTNQELADQLISTLELDGDRVFDRKCLGGIYGSNRLDILNSYFKQWQLGRDFESVEIKKENAGHNRADVWLRDKTNHE